jgi:hypothetical protein
VSVYVDKIVAFADVLQVTIWKTRRLFRLLKMTLMLFEIMLSLGNGIRDDLLLLSYDRCCDGEFQAQSRKGRHDIERGFFNLSCHYLYE